MKDMLDSHALYPFTYKLGLSIETVEELTEKAKEELEDPRLKLYIPLSVLILEYFSHILTPIQLCSMGTASEMIHCHIGILEHVRCRYCHCLESIRWMVDTFVL